LDTRRKRKRVAIACQGGGSHTAFTARVLKRLLRAEQLKELEVVASVVPQAGRYAPCSHGTTC